MNDTKDHYVFYFDRSKPKKGDQSAHLGVIIVLHRLMPADDGGTKSYYRFGIAIKHPRDKVPFIKREGRNVAMLRAGRCPPVFTIDNLVSQVRYELLHMSIVGQDETRVFDMKRLLTRMAYVIDRHPRVD